MCGMSYWERVFEDAGCSIAERRVDMQHAVVTSSYELAKGVVNSQKSGVVYPCVL
jgi:hypothetical protein